MVQGAVEDPLTIPKLQVFITVSRVLKPYLQLFQRIDPMIPFVADELFNMTKAVMAKFVKKEVLEKASTPTKLANVDLSKSNYLLPPKKVVIGFAAVDDMESKKQLSARDVLQFQPECLSFMKELTKKLQQRSPLKYPIVRYLVSLDPRYMATKPSATAEQFEKLLQKLYELLPQTAENCDIILQQYKQFVDEVQKYHKEQFLGFCIAEDPLDSLLYSHVGDAKPQYAALWDTNEDAAHPVPWTVRGWAGFFTEQRHHGYEYAARNPYELSLSVWWFATSLRPGHWLCQPWDVEPLQACPLKV